MLPVLSAEQVRAADAYTIGKEPIAAIDMMERAATRCTERLLILHNAGRFGEPGRITYLIVAGMGNNGGDGLVVARLLHQAGIPLRVMRVMHKTEASPEHAANYRRAMEAGIGVADMISSGDEFHVLDTDVIIDALFGTGLNAPLTGLPAHVVAWINASGRPIVSIDMPSGLLPEDNRANDPKHIIRARHTISFQVPKLAFFFAENAPYVGDLELVPIGLDPQFLHDEPVIHRVVERHDVIALLRPRPRFAHKGTFGHALLVAGGKGHTGAAVLATRAALRSGAGLITAHVPAASVIVVQISAPEAICSEDPSGTAITTLPDLAGFSAIGIGPGLGINDGTPLVVKRLLQDAPSALVIDADAVNILAENPTWLAFLPIGTILTPHPKEFDRLVGKKIGSGFERLELAREMALKNKCTIVLKGAWTAVCDPAGQVFFNPTGNPGMAKGGSGDVLTGLLTGLLAQGYASVQAAVLGVYLHGLAGDLAAQRVGIDAMTAGDLIEALPLAWRDLRGSSEQAVQ